MAETITITNVEKEQKTNAAGKPYTIYRAELDDGRTASFFDKDLAAAAMNSRGNPTDAELEKGRFGWDLKSVGGVTPKPRQNGGQRQGGSYRPQATTVAEHLKGARERIILAEWAYTKALEQASLDDGVPTVASLENSAGLFYDAAVKLANEKA